MIFLSVGNLVDAVTPLHRIFALAMTITIQKDAIIAESKIRDYLLAPQKKDDKSRFLAIAGYTRKDFWELLRDIREQLLPAEAEFQYHRADLDFYIVRGVLVGPNRQALAVRTVWAKNLLNEIRFVTLIPDRKRYNEIRTL